MCIHIAGVGVGVKLMVGVTVGVGVGVTDMAGIGPCGFANSCIS
jgi:hypothetical protein